MKRHGKALVWAGLVLVGLAGVVWLAQESRETESHPQIKSSKVKLHVATKWMVYAPAFPDVNGDGRPDLIASVSAVHHQFMRDKSLPPAGTPVIVLQGKDRTFRDLPFVTSWKPASGRDGDPVFMDVTKDGRDDLIQIAPPAESSGQCGSSPAGLGSDLCGNDFGKGPQWLTVQVAAENGSLGPIQRIRMLDEEGRRLTHLPWKATLAWGQTGDDDTVWLFTGEDSMTPPTSPLGTGGKSTTVAMTVTAPLTMKIGRSLEAWWYGGRADINGDGKDELMVQHTTTPNGPADYVIYDGATGTSSTISLPHGTLEDVTGDGRADVVGVRKKSGEIKIYNGTSKNTFGEARVVEGLRYKRRTDYSVADIDNDEQPDLLVGVGGSGDRPSEWLILRGDIDRGFLPPRLRLRVPGDLRLAGVKDLDGDGNVDLLFQGDARPSKEQKDTYLDWTYVAWGKGDGTFE